ncbi:MAG: hypothetical protein F6K23_33505 [Okeania sp. SIO2C9]|uniref:hypothetical protein n=1 Tax=Okeania sp. SIO2C9 TaxID=2607791 RepID=UPI0013C0D228|nr:hypothetical protein [Okeania sp. SIO2C9]NEQ77497.1 hypothetical protein [Okeania sp. SIO2C9]
MWGTGDKNLFNGAVKVKQPVLNIGEYCSHLIQLLNNLIKEEKINLKTNHQVTNIQPSKQGFELQINQEKKVIL